MKASPFQILVFHTFHDALKFEISTIFYITTDEHDNHKGHQNGITNNNYNNYTLQT